MYIIYTVNMLTCSVCAQGTIQLSSNFEASSSEPCKIMSDIFQCGHQIMYEQPKHVGQNCTLMLQQLHCFYSHVFVLTSLWSKWCWFIIFVSLEWKIALVSCGLFFVYHQESHKNYFNLPWWLHGLPCSCHGILCCGHNRFVPAQIDLLLIF